MTIKIGKGAQALGFALVLIGSMVITVAAAQIGNEFWYSPLIALAVMFFIGHLPSSNKEGRFQWIYFVLILGSGALLLFTSQQVYWTSPLLLGVLYNIIVE